MASQSTSTTAGAGSSSAPTVVSILPNNRNPQIWKDFNLCLMSDNTKKAQCIHCLHFFSKDSNSTLKSHINHPHCEAKKRGTESGQSSMSRDGSIFVYNLDVLREQFAGLVIQRGLPFNHFDDEQTTRIEPDTWQMMKRVIAFEDFPVPHTGSALAKTLINVFVKFKLENKIMSITLDNANNNTSALGKLGLKYKPPMDGRFYHSRCVARIINLCVQDGLVARKEKNSFRSIRMDMDILSVQATSVASESAFSTNHMDAQEHKQDKSTLETHVDFEEKIFDVEVPSNEAIPLSGWKKIAWMLLSSE
ncbi:zinc finger BED domain-containing protein RICESLEEPER 2-like protein, partial [Tanacetum coccineum]